MLEEGRYVLARTDTATLAHKFDARWMDRVAAWVEDRNGVVVANLYLRDVRLNLPMAVPDTIADALPGRPLSDLLDLSGLILSPHTRIVSVQCRAARGPSQLFKSAGHVKIDWPISSSPGFTFVMVEDAFMPVCS